MTLAVMRSSLSIRHLPTLLLLPLVTGQSLIDVLSDTPELGNFTTWLTLFPDFSTQLTQVQDVTILAPDNIAFGELLNSSAGVNLTDQVGGAAFLSYHMLEGTYNTIDNLITQEFLSTGLQSTQYTNVTGGQRVHVQASSGLVDSGLASTSRIISRPLTFEGGVVYVIDIPLTIPVNFSTTAVDLNLTACVGASTSTELLDVFDLRQDVTIFVPNNEAFNNIGNLISNFTTEDLTNIMSYHAVSGRVVYSDTYRGTSLPTLDSGKNLTITALNNDVYVNSARILISDILIANGVIHVIDNVLNPDHRTVGPVDGTSQVAFANAVAGNASGLTSGVPSPTGTSKSSETSTPAGGLSKGALSGAIVGGVIGGLVIIGAVVFIWRRKRQGSKARTESSGAAERKEFLSDDYGKAELSGAGVHERQAFSKPELWTNANRHEADGTRIQRGTGEAVELPGEDINTSRSRRPDDLT